MVEVEWDRAIRDSFVSAEVSLNTGVVLILENTHTWVSGRTIFNPRGESDSYTLENSQSLAANPPTSTTCWKCRKLIGDRYLKNDAKTDRDSFMCTIPLFKDCFDYTIYRWLKELGNIRPKKIKISTFKLNQVERIQRIHPINFNWPNRMLQLLSLSLVDPNLTYSGSSAFLNRSLVVLSKQRTIYSRSSRNVDSFK